ncbi:hypothetical protein ACVBIL_03425 [Shewanella sp. 125m-7]
MTQNTLNLFMGAFYVIAILIAIGFTSWMVIVKRKNMALMKKNVLGKLSSGFELSSKDIVHIGRGFGLTPYQSRNIIYKIHGDIIDKDEFYRLKNLIEDIEKEEPFDELPDEVKPSLIRLTAITSNSSSESDRHLLSPIVHTLSKYMDMTSEQENLKKKTNRAYILTVVSFLIGAISFYFTLQSPSAEQIATEIQKQSQSAGINKDNK